jgi:hypothetical protein
MKDIVYYENVLNFNFTDPTVIKRQRIINPFPSSYNNIVQLLKDTGLIIYFRDYLLEDQLVETKYPVIEIDKRIKPLIQSLSIFNLQDIARNHFSPLYRCGAFITDSILLFEKSLQ